MSSLAISSRYAQALFDAATDGGNALTTAKTALSQLSAFNDVFESSRELRIALSNPAIPFGQRQNISSSVLAKVSTSEGSDSRLDALLKLLVSRGRIAILPDLAATYEAIVFEAEGRVRARVRSAAALDERYRLELTRALEKKTGKKVELDVIVEPELISGLVAIVGSERFDGSVRGQLDALQQVNI